MPQAILFDLDETLTDRTRSIFHYAERFRDDFANHLVSTTVATIAEAILRADVRGYRGTLPMRGDRLMRHWEKIIRGGCLVMLVIGMLMACTPMGSVRDRTPDRASTPTEVPTWSNRGSDAS